MPVSVVEPPDTGFFAQTKSCQFCKVHCKFMIVVRSVFRNRNNGVGHRDYPLARENVLTKELKPVGDRNVKT